MGSRIEVGKNAFQKHFCKVFTGLFSVFIKPRTNLVEPNAQFMEHNVHKTKHNEHWFSLNGFNAEPTLSFDAARSPLMYDLSYSLEAIPYDNVM